MVRRFPRRAAHAPALTQVSEAEIAADDMLPSDGVHASLRRSASLDLPDSSAQLEGDAAATDAAVGAAAVRSRAAHAEREPKRPTSSGPRAEHAYADTVRAFSVALSALGLHCLC